MASYGADIESRPKEVKIDESTIAGQAFITHQTVHVKDIAKDLRYDRSYIEPTGPHEVIAIPVIFEGECYGVIQIYRLKPFSKRQTAFANILAQGTGPTLYHIAASKVSRQTILELVESIFESTSSEEMFNRAVKKISERLEIPSCLVYRVSPTWCEIITGVPKGAHEIGLKEFLKEHEDILSATTEKQIIVIDHPLTDLRTKHMRGIIEAKNIKAIMEVPIISHKGFQKDPEPVIGVLVLDACGEKTSFSAEEKSFCSDAAKILAQLFDHDRITVMEIEHRVKNSSQTMGKYAERLITPLTEIYEVLENECRILKKCITAERNLSIVASAVTNAEIVKREATRIDNSMIQVTLNHA